MNPPTCLLLRGLPGSGKSTVARLLATLPGAVSICADDYPGRYIPSPEGPQFVPSLARPALDWCRESVRHHMEYGTPVIIVHNVFPRQQDIAEYAELARQYNYRLMVLRVEGRFPSEHNVPPEVMGAMQASFEPWPPTEGGTE